MDVRVHGGLGTFDEVAETIRHGLHALTTAGVTLPDRTILLGAHLLSPVMQPDPRLIFYNFEQRDSPPLNNSVLHLFRQHEVWDYSASNVAWFAERGVKAKHVPIGYMPELKRIAKIEPDIDVLFYGLVNTRRRYILNDLKAAGLKLHETVNCYGRERDELIGRSKIVLNMHFYETHIFEMVRCSYLFTNEVCVVSENSIDIPTELEHAVPFAPYGPLLVEGCVRLVRDSSARTRWAERAHNSFRASDETLILRAALQGA